MPERSRWARGMILTRYSMRGFEFGEELLRVAPLSKPGLVQALANSLASVGAGRDVEQPLIGSGVLDDGLGFAVDCQHHWPLAFLELLHEIPGAPAKSRERLNVLGDVKHLAASNY